MNDPRLNKLAKVLVNYSVEAKPGQLVRVAGDSVAEPLIIELAREIIAVGAHPIVFMTPEEITEILYKTGNEDQLKYISPVQWSAIENIDASIGIWGSRNTKMMSNCETEKQAIASAAMKPYRDKFFDRVARGEVKWSGTQYPCLAHAQDAEMSLSEYEDFVYGAGLLHEDDPAAAWRKVEARQQKLIDFLDDKDEVRVVTPQGTDVRFGLKGRTWLNCCGHENFPDGEVFTGPVEDQVEGRVVYSFPAVHGGREVQDIVMTFKEGKVVEATASRNQDYLIKMLDQDAGARTIGELAFGCNYSITNYTKNTLFDEKIGGTIHTAVGAGYPETGSKNKSGLHWDMVCDLRNGGKIFVDGELISENGKFLNLEWPGE